MEINNETCLLVLIAVLIVIISFISYHLNQARCTIDYLRSVSQSDLEQFYGGVRKSTYFVDEETETKVEQLILDSSYKLHYDKLHIDMDKVLGQGEFGIVFKGEVCYEGTWRNAAVKTSKAFSNQKSILTETKLLAYIGTHPNVIQLFGFSNSKEGSLFIAIEFCEYGSLQHYLRNGKAAKFDVITVDSLSDFGYEKSVTQPDAFHQNIISMAHMTKWALEIAKGMNYLVKKKIIHSDLATRNILLVGDLSIRITDFGLSRRLYENPVYVKVTQEPLPWRWMAYESLFASNYSSQSDVWSYGITIWEIFSLGQMPYPGINWSSEFVTQLRDGMRLEQPGLCPYNVYTKLMTCWSLEPNSRPNFTELEDFFATIPGAMSITNIESYVNTIPYDRSYEIPANRINLEVTMGSCGFGTVFLGKMEKGGVWSDVYVKTTLGKPNAISMGDVLTHLKLMIFAGPHPNIIRLLGANTEKVQQGVLHIVIEHCLHGNLHRYLNRSTFATASKDQQKLAEPIAEKSTFFLRKFLTKYGLRGTSKLQNQDSPTAPVVTISQMSSWSRQIAEGMAYLGSKNIIHSELHTRNILVADDLTMRITNYGFCIRPKIESISPFPQYSWRLLSYESLKHGTFTQKSDVWSYGIALWEIFSLGQRPYNGRSYDPDFPEALKAGVRNTKPLHSSEAIYRKMLQCWDIEPEKRPSFSNLKDFFAKVETQDKLGIVYLNS